MKTVSGNIGVIAITALMSIAPLTASASTSASSSANVWFSSQGIVHAIGATVTSVGANIVTAATTIGNTVLTWSLNVSNDTRLKVEGLNATSTSAIAVGDKIRFTGALTGTSSTPVIFTVAATKIVDASSTVVRMHGKDHKEKNHSVGMSASTTVEASHGHDMDEDEHGGIFGLGLNASLKAH